MIVTQYQTALATSPLKSSNIKIRRRKPLHATHIATSYPSTKRTRQEMPGAPPSPKRRTSSPLSHNHHSDSHRLSLQRFHSNSTADSSPLTSEPVEEVSVSLSPASAPLDLCDDPDADHVIRLSSIEHCMPRAYIRVCLAYRLAPDKDIDAVIGRLNNFIRRTVDAKPYLAGFILPVNKENSAGPVEIRFTNDDFLTYPKVEVRHLYEDDGSLMDYDQLNALGFPPSKLHPDKVAVLPAVMADERRAPVFRAQANIVRGGLIVSFYLHHCISDGTGLGLLASGSVQDDDFTFKRHLQDIDHRPSSVGERLAAFANYMSIVRQKLSWSSPNQTPSRPIAFKRLGVPVPGNRPGRGCIITIPFSTIEKIRTTLEACLPSHSASLTKHDVLQALIWRHMARARLAAIDQRTISKSKLLVPVNIRGKLKEPLSESYFGAAVDFASAEFDLKTLTGKSTKGLAQAAALIRAAVVAVDEPYIRQVIALARSSDPTVDVRDLLASNMNRVTGADMYITSWQKLDLYNAELDMGIGRPDWVRKPWSRDPGSCIILPQNHRKPQPEYEVVVQMTEADMERLLDDDDFMANVTGVVD